MSCSLPTVCGFSDIYSLPIVCGFSNSYSLPIVCGFSEVTVTRCQLCVGSQTVTVTRFQLCVGSQTVTRFQLCVGSGRQLLAANCVWVLRSYCYSLPIVCGVSDSYCYLLPIVCGFSDSCSLPIVCRFWQTFTRFQLCVGSGRQLLAANCVWVLRQLLLL